MNTQVRLLMSGGFYPAWRWAIELSDDYTSGRHVSGRSDRETAYPASSASMSRARSGRKVITISST
jgi:hypothetical protein